MKIDAYKNTITIPLLIIVERIFFQDSLKGFLLFGTRERLLLEDSSKGHGMKVGRRDRERESAEGTGNEESSK